MSNELLGYIVLFAGVVIGWGLCWLWRSVRERRKRIADILFRTIQKGYLTFKEFEYANKMADAYAKMGETKAVDLEYSDGKLKIIKQKKKEK